WTGPHTSSAIWLARSSAELPLPGSMPTSRACRATPLCHPRRPHARRAAASNHADLAWAVVFHGFVLTPFPCNGKGVPEPCGVGKATLLEAAALLACASYHQDAPSCERCPLAGMRATAGRPYAACQAMKLP